MDSPQKLEINTIINGKKYILNIDAYKSSIIRDIINTVEHGLAQTQQIKFITQKWGLEQAAIWERKYADYVCVQDLLELSKSPTILRVTLV